jgi:hypothetical protein
MAECVQWSLGWYGRCGGHDRTGLGCQYNTEPGPRVDRGWVQDHGTDYQENPGLKAEVTGTSYTPYSAIQDKSLQ